MTPGNPLLKAVGVGAICGIASGLLGIGGAVIMVPLLVAVLGAAMLGGVPGSSLLGLLPMWSTHGWMSLTGAAGDWQLVASTAARSLPGLVSPATQVVAALLFVGGLAGVVASVRRWRRLLSWHRDA